MMLQPFNISTYRNILSSIESPSLASMEDQLSSPISETHHQSLLEPRDPKKLALIPLVFLIFFEVSGGAYGEESTVGAAGPLFAIIGFIVFPFIWSIPEALLTAELATAFPGNGGFVIWANHAFGPFWGSLMGSWKYLTGVLNMASYPVLCIDYIKLVFPVLDSGLPHYAAVFASTLVLSFLNYTGLAVVGYTAVTLGVLALSPFVVLTIFSIPKIDPSRWISLGQTGVKKNWPLYFNTLFWNLNFWDSASTLAGEVENPQKTYPKALFSSGLLAILGYLVPLLAATGAVTLNQEDWTDGYFADLAEIIAGKWLKYWMEIGACLSVIGLYEAQLSSVAYQLLGMANMGFVPPLFGVKAKWFDTPWVAILISTLIAIITSYMDFDDIVNSANFMYSLSMLLEFAAFLWLRIKLPELKRPFGVPMGLPGLIIMCLIPSGFLIYVMTVSTTGVLVVSAVLTLVGITWYFLMKLCKSKMWIQFNNSGEELEFEA